MAEGYLLRSYNKNEKNPMGKNNMTTENHIEIIMSHGDNYESNTNNTNEVSQQTYILL